MFSKIIDFLLMAGCNGVIAIFISIVVCFVSVILLSFALLPICIIFGDGAAMRINNFVNWDYCFRGVYVIIFVSLMMDDLGIPNFKTAFKNWKDNRKGTVKG